MDDNYKGTYECSAYNEGTTAKKAYTLMYKGIVQHIVLLNPIRLYHKYLNTNHFHFSRSFIYKILKRNNRNNIYINNNRHLPNIENTKREAIQA